MRLNYYSVTVTSTKIWKEEHQYECEPLKERIRVLKRGNFSGFNTLIKSDIILKPFEEKMSKGIRVSIWCLDKDVERAKARVLVLNHIKDLVNEQIKDLNAIKLNIREKR